MHNLGDDELSHVLFRYEVTNMSLLSTIGIIFGVSVWSEEKAVTLDIAKLLNFAFAHLVTPYTQLIVQMGWNIAHLVFTLYSVYMCTES